MTVGTLTHEERPELAVNAETRNNVLLIWYHESDLDLVRELDPHLQLLVWRMENQFVLHYFGYPKVMPKPPSSEEYASHKREREEYEARYASTLQAFSHCALFVPCISNACMVQMCKDAERDPRLGKILAQLAYPIMPILMRPTNTGEANPPEPLSAHDAGYQREVACQHIAARIESILRASSSFKPAQPPLATRLLAAAPPKVVKKPWWSLFR